jgi:hypothetical protein
MFKEYAEGYAASEAGSSFDRDASEDWREGYEHAHENRATVQEMRGVDVFLSKGI